MVRNLLPLLALLLAVSPAAAHPQASPLSDAARVSVITVLPGTDVHALFGHTALRLHDPQTGFDAVYNYGTFDFSDPLFVPRFVHGQMDYFLSVHGFQAAVDHYRDREGRPVIVQELDLTQHEIDHIYYRLRTEALPENRVYRYDFFFDNCSTRPRDVVEDALGSRLQYAEPVRGSQSFRELLAPYIASRPFLSAGIDLLLGSPTDRPATTRETMFLPLDLFDRLESATVIGDAGPRPLVARTDTVAWVEGYEMEADSWPWATIVTVVLLMVGLYYAWREFRLGATTSTTIDAILFAFAGLIGLLIAYMWFVSEHTVTGPNWNLLWAWPTHLVAAYLIQRGRAERFTRQYLATSSIVTFLVAAFWFVWPQQLPIAFFPLVILLAVRSAILWHRYRRRGAPTIAS